MEKKKFWVLGLMYLILSGGQTTFGQPASRAPRTFCNPLNLNYGIRNIKDEGSRHGADPDIVLWEDRYYLFSTWDLPGYRVSDDLVNWTYIPFTGELKDQIYTAAAVAQVGDWLYYTPFGKTSAPVKLYRTHHPESGEWEVVGGPLPPYSDPCLFVDPKSGKLYVTFGLEKPTHIVELDPKTGAEMPGTSTQLLPDFDKTKRIENGWEVCTNDNSEASPPMRGNHTFFPCREGSWMTFYNNKYYLQYASPGTTIGGYADGLATSDSLKGPYSYSQFSPISHKDSGFIASAGHSCLFQDRYGNWWRAVTMLIGVHERMERRIGLFPAGFDKEGVLYTRTDLGDLPITLPTGPRDHLGEIHPGWFVLSQDKTVTASSSLDDHAPALASDENIRTWWSAKTGGADEWMQLDLGKAYDLHAVQINLAEQDYTKLDSPPTNDQPSDYHRYKLSASADCQKWDVVVDTSNNSVASPHMYVEFEKPVSARYLKVQNVFTPGGGKFAVSDLRAFGVGDAKPPAAVTDLTVQRDEKDRRKVSLKWKASDGATSYQIRYGIQADTLNQNYLLRAKPDPEMTLYTLNNDPPYFFTVDALNDRAVTAGTQGVKAP